MVSLAESNLGILTVRGSRDQERGMSVRSSQFPVSRSQSSPRATSPTDNREVTTGNWEPGKVSVPGPGERLGAARAGRGPGTAFGSGGGRRPRRVGFDPAFGPVADGVEGRS